jgi:pyruvate dehydrogenase E1 component alpha subunit
MPRTPVNISAQIDYLSILDEQGKIDKDLEPNLSAEQLKTLYHYMLLARRLDERMLIMQRQGRLSTFAQCTGHEAISLGAAFALNKTDSFIPYYRELAGMLYRGWPIENFLLYWNGFEEGAMVPKDLKDLPFCVPISSQLLHAVGMGMAINIQDGNNVVVVFFGDGAASEGDCHEALNFAGVFNAPVVFICVNNQYAISVPLSKQMKAKTIVQRAIAYDMPGIRVDGNDILAVYSATEDAIARARQGGGPTLIEAVTYRIAPHTTADDPKRYRSDDEVALWLKREPLVRFRQYMYDKNLISKEEEEKLEEQINSDIKLSIEKAEVLAQSFELSNPLNIFDYSYAEIPPCVQRQKKELEDYLQYKKGTHKKGKN